MTLLDIISLDSTIVGLESDSKEAIIEELVGCLQTGTALTDREKVLQAVLDREKIMSTGIGDGIAIPHLKMRRVRVPFTMMMTMGNDVHHETPDGKPVNIYSLLISPAEDGPLHLRRLSRISRLLRNESLCQRLRDTQDRDVIQSLLIDPEGWTLAA